MLVRQVGRSLLVAHVDASARQAGLRAGLTLAEARALVPNLLALADQPRRDREALERLADWAQRFSPLVEPVAPDRLLLDITGCERLFGGEANIARQARAGLWQQGYHARAAIADTVGAACALAVGGRTPLINAPPGRTRETLADLPPSTLRIEPAVAERLAAVGIRTIGALLELPRETLPARFGPHLVRRLQQALGEVPEEVTAYRGMPPPAVGRRFETPLREPTALRAVLARLLAELAARLERRALAVRRVDCVLICEDVGPRVLSVGLSRASRAWQHIRELLERRLEGVDLGPGLTAVRLMASQTDRWRPSQGGLFEPTGPTDVAGLGCLLDRLAARLGHDAVVRAILVDDYQPERAYRYVAPLADAQDRGQRAEHPEVALPIAARPTCLLPRPLPIRVIALLPDGPPSWFAWAGREYRVGQAWGPERIETGWWRGADVRRDYFCVSTETGARFWIFHNAADRQWYLHGIFA